MRIRPVSIRLRLTLWYSLVLALIVVIFSVSIYFFVKGRLFRQVDHQLREDLASLTQVVTKEPDEVREIEPGESPKLFLVTREASLYFQSAPYQKAGLPMITTPGPERYRTVRSRTGRDFRVMTGATPNGFMLTVAESEGPVRGTLEHLFVILVSALPAALILATLGGYLMAGRLLHPVAAMTEQANRISAENLSARLPVHDPEDEFGQLALVFNRTLSRLQSAFERLQRFTADASHELRTPLTAIQSVGEVALRENLEPGEYRDRIGSMLEETARLTRLVESLLVLTRADGGHLSFELKDSDLTSVVEKVIEDYRVMAEEKDQQLVTDIQKGLRACIDAETLRQALVNILDNALKYTPSRGMIAVKLKERPDQLIVEVTDSGPGIAPEHRDKIFDRFYRIERDRPQDVGGAGLGLAIAKWAVEANGGRLELDSAENRGSTFRVLLPKIPPAQG
jgi:heavy metal sensor kinase